MHTLHRRGIGFRYSTMFTALVSLACAQGIQAASDGNGGFACGACTVLSSDELDALRGGFQFAGLNFQFGANIRSFIDNFLVLESIVTITSDGTIQHQTITLPDSLPGTAELLSPPAPQGAGRGTQAVAAELPAAPPPPAAAPGVSSPMAASSTPNPPTTVTSDAVAPNVDLTGLGNALGVSIHDHKGFTAALHEATRERITSTLINTANDRTLRQEMEIMVNVENFRQFQQTTRQSLLNARLEASRLR